MIDKEAITKVADTLHADDFYKRNHQYIYEVVENLFTSGEPIDLISVASKLKEIVTHDPEINYGDMAILEP